MNRNLQAEQRAEAKMFAAVNKYREKWGLFSLLRVLYQSLSEVEIIARRLQ